MFRVNRGEKNQNDEAKECTRWQNDGRNVGAMAKARLQLISGGKADFKVILCNLILDG